MAVNNSAVKINSNLEELNKKIRFLYDIVNKHARSDNDVSGMRGRYGEGQEHTNIDPKLLKEFSELNEKEKKELKEKWKKTLRNTNSKLDREIKKLQKILDSGKNKNGTSLTQSQRSSFQQQLDLKINTRSSDENQQLEAKFNQERDTALGDMKARAAFKNEYDRQTRVRANASEMISQSGFGNTFVGRMMDKYIDTKQSYHAMANYGNYLKYSGGAEELSKSMFGTTAFTKIFKSLGGALENLGTKMGGAMAKAGVILAIIKAVKDAVIDVVNDFKEYKINILEAAKGIRQSVYDYEYQRLEKGGQLALQQFDARAKGQMRMLEAYAKIATSGMQIVGENYAKSAEIATGALIEGINESAFAALRQSVKASADIMKWRNASAYELLAASRERALSEYEANVYAKQANIDLALAKTEAEVQMRQHYIDMYFEDKAHFLVDNIGGQDINTVSKNLGVQERLTDRMSRQVEKDIGGSVTTWEYLRDYNAFGGDWEKYKEYKTSIFQAKASKELGEARLAATLASGRTQVDLLARQQSVQLQNQAANTLMEAKNALIDAAQKINERWIALTEKVEKWLSEFDDDANKVGLNLGLFEKNMLRNYKDTMLPILEKTSAKWARDREATFKVQSQYLENSGKNRFFGENEYNAIFALGTILGDDSLATEYAAKMDIFNVGIADSVQKMNIITQDVNKANLNYRKVGKTIVSSLKLAQKYTFKGGVDSMMKMAVWAENARFDITKLPSIIDKINEGGIEGVIEQAAQLQVLGGPIAMNADPIAMMYEAQMDPFALGQRVQRMVKGFGYIDKKTGEGRLYGYQTMMVNDIAKALGMESEELRRMIFAERKKEEVAKYLNPSIKEDYQKDAIANSAFYDQLTQKWKVSYLNGNQIDTMDVDKIQPGDIKKMIPAGHNERMEVYAQSLLDAVQGTKVEELAQIANIGTEAYAGMVEAYRQRAQNAQDDYNKNREKYIQEAINGMDEQTKATEDYMKHYEDGNTEIKKAEDQMEKISNNIQAQLGQVQREVNQALRVMNDFARQLGGASIGSPGTSAENLASDNGNRMSPLQKWYFNAKGEEFHKHFNKQNDEYFLLKDVNDFLVKSGKESLLQNYVNRNGYWEYADFDTNYANIVLQLIKMEKWKEAMDYFNESDLSSIKYYDVNEFKKSVGKEPTTEATLYDGSVKLVQSHPDDSAIFAKSGGAFDKYFKNVNTMVTSIQSLTLGNDMMPFDDFDEELYLDITETLEKGDTYNNGGFLNVRLNGRLDLVSQYGQSVDLISELRNDNNLHNTISRIISREVMKGLMS